MAGERVTLLDLTIETGLSQKVTKAALHGVHTVPDELRIRVTQASQRIGYHPRVIPALEVPMVVSDPQLLKVSAGIGQLLRDFRIFAPQTLTFNSQNAEKRAIKSLMGMDGLVLFGSSLSPADCQKLADNGTSVMLVEPEKSHRGSKDPHYSLIETDHHEAGLLAMQELTGKGHHRIAYLERTTETYPELRRQKGMRDAIARTATDGVDFVVVPSPLSEPDPYKAGFTQVTHMLEAMQYTPDGIIASSDEVAIGAMSALIDCGISIPENISVVGFGNSEIGQYRIPRLTSVSVVWEDKVRAITEYLLTMFTERQILFLNLL